MKLELINHDSTKLLIFFCGFYTDASCFAEFDNCSCDILFVWDYSELNYDVFDDIDFTPYTEINLIAYSYGVWAAAGQVREYLPHIEKSIAISGTLLPVDDEFGVPRKTFDFMLNALSWDTMEKFQKKVLRGTPAEHLNANRELQNLKDELSNVLKNSGLHRSSCRGCIGCNYSCYDNIILTQNDKIFPYRSQSTFWQNHANKTELACGHFPFYEFRNFEEILKI